jgi:outer membrane protein
MEDWQQRMLKLQNDFLEYQKELQKRQAELTLPIVNKVKEIISRLAKKNGYEVVIDKQVALYVRTDLDLTEQVVQMYNSGGGGDADEKKPDNK